MTTIKELAKAAGVGTTAVSAALNGNGRVGSQTKAKILKIAREKGYQPNASAQALRKRTVIDFGMIVADNQSMFIMDFLQYCDEHSLRNQIEQISSEKPHFPLLLTPGYAKGVLYVGNIISQVRDFIEKNPDFPIITINELSPFCICPDFETGIRNGIHQLVKNGCKNLLLYYKSSTCYYELAVTCKVMLECIEELKKNPEMTVNTCTYSLDEEKHTLFDKILPHLDSPNPPDGFFMSGMYVTSRLVYELTKRGIRIPEDTQIMASCLRSDAEKVYPEVSSVEADLHLIAEKAIDLLERRIKGKAIHPEQILSPTKIVYRKTTIPQKGRRDES